MNTTPNSLQLTLLTTYEDNLFSLARALEAAGGDIVAILRQPEFRLVMHLLARNSIEISAVYKGEAQ